MTLTSGIYTDMSAGAYFADPCPAPSLTQSICKVLLDRSPAHARLAHPRLNPDWRDDDDGYDRALAVGNAAHRIVLGRGKEVVIIEANDFRTNEAKSARAAAVAKGKVAILAKHHKAVTELAAELRRQLDGMGLDRAFREGCGDAEVVIAWNEGGIWFRSMLDWIDRSAPIYLDLKTSGLSAAPHAVPSTMANAGWAIQAAFQERGLDIVDPANAGRRRFLFAMAENEPPYALTVNELSEAVMTIGRKQVDYAVRIWRECLETNHWPTYPPFIHMPEYPGYAEAKWLDREIAEFARRQAVKMVTDLAGG
jgi:hypothetical protein